MASRPLALIGGAMKFKEIAARVTGLSCPIFGVQWNPPEAERAIARRILAFLEDRRVLYVPGELESPPHCVDSVIQIRGFLTSELGRLADESELSNSLRCMRAACRKFLATVQADDRRKIVHHSHQMGHFASWIFTSALGEMRGVFGLHIARLAASHGLDIEDELAVIVPFRDDER
jgi:hypothetical protein